VDNNDAEDQEEPSLLLGGEAETTDSRHKSSLLGLFPGFSTSRYGRRHRQRRRKGSDSSGDSEPILPPGVTKPEKLIMHSNPVNVEPKVWLANQRTFIKWEHVSILLATLSLGLYNAAGKNNTIAHALGLAYTGIALFTGIWGYWVYLERSRLIRERSGKDFDQRLGPIVVSLGLAAALCLNFGFKFHAALEKHKNNPLVPAPGLAGYEEVLAAAAQATMAIGESVAQTITEAYFAPAAEL